MDYGSFTINYNSKLDADDKNTIEAYVIDFIKNYHNFRTSCITHNFLLNIDDIKNNMNVDIIEKFIYDNAINVIKQYNIRYNTSYTIDDFYIEFWGVTYDTYRGMHFDVDEMAVELEMNNCNPSLFSSVLYLSDINRTPLLISNVKRPKNTCNFLENIVINSDKNDEMVLYFPRKYKQLIFDGAEYFHGLIQFEDCCINDRYILGNSFYLKKQKPLYLAYYSHYSYMRWVVAKEKDIDNNPSNCKDIFPNSLLAFNEKLKTFPCLTTIEKDKSTEKEIQIFVQNTYKYNVWYNNLIKNGVNESFEFIKNIVYNEMKINKEQHIFRLKMLKNESENSNKINKML